ncbi:MAG: hypothetical protein ACKPEY_05855, partial [Planctomycetota bacterium]
MPSVTQQEELAFKALMSQGGDPDPAETAEWLDALEYVLTSKGGERVKYLIAALQDKARREGIDLPVAMNTPYINTIPADRQPAYPGNRELERRIKSIIRWNAMAMVVRANKDYAGVGGHISSFASATTTEEMIERNFIECRGGGEGGD